MGLSYPYLAILTTILFATTMGSILFTYIFVMQGVQTIPQFESYALFEPVATGCRITLTLRLVSGKPVTLHYVRVSTDAGVLEVATPGDYTAPNGANATVVFDGFAGGRSLYVGQTGRVVVTVSNCKDLFTYGKTYSVFTVLDEGSVVSYLSVPIHQITQREIYDYIVFQDSMGWTYVKDGWTGEVVYVGENPVEVINYAIAKTPQHGSVYVAHVVVNPPHLGEIKLLGKRKVVFEYLYVNATPDSGGDILSNFYTEPFEDGTLIATIVSNGQGNWLGVALVDARNAYIDLRIINVSESGAYIVRPSNSKIRLHIVSTGYAAISGMEGALIEGGSNNYIEVHIYDSYRDGLALVFSHDNYVVGKIRKTGRHGLVLDNSHNNFLQLSLEDIRARAGLFGEPDGCGLYIKDSYNNYGVVGLANPFYTPAKDIYIEGGSGNNLILLHKVSGVVDVPSDNNVSVIGS